MKMLALLMVDTIDTISNNFNYVVLLSFPLLAFSRMKRRSWVRGNSDMEGNEIRWLGWNLRPKSQVAIPHSAREKVRCYWIQLRRAEWWDTQEVLTSKSSLLGCLNDGTRIWYCHIERKGMRKGPPWMFKKSRIISDSFQHVVTRWKIQ